MSLYNSRQKPGMMSAPSMASGGGGAQQLASYGRRVRQGPANYSGRAGQGMVTPQRQPLAQTADRSFRRTGPQPVRDFNPAPPSVTLGGSGVPGAAPPGRRPGDVRNPAFGGMTMGGGRLPFAGMLGKPGMAPPGQRPGDVRNPAFGNMRMGGAPAGAPGAPPMRPTNMMGGERFGSLQDALMGGRQVMGGPAGSVLGAAAPTPMQQRVPNPLGAQASQIGLTPEQTAMNMIWDTGRGFVDDAADATREIVPGGESAPEGSLTDNTVDAATNLNSNIVQTAGSDSGNPFGAPGDMIADILAGLTKGIGETVLNPISTSMTENDIGLLDKYQGDSVGAYNDMLDASRGIMSPEARRAAEEAARKDLYAGVSSNKDADLRRLYAQAGRGGRMSAGGETGINQTAAEALASGERGLAQDAFGRQLSATQTGLAGLGQGGKLLQDLRDAGITTNKEVAAMLLGGADRATDLLKALDDMAKGPFAGALGI